MKGANWRVHYLCCNIGNCVLEIESERKLTVVTLNGSGISVVCMPADKETACYRKKGQKLFR
jgi:hypothetical protein